MSKDREQRVKDIEELLETSANAQREKLLSDKNMAKSPWSEMSLGQLHKRLHDEVGELDQELKPSWVDLKKVLSEAVDVSNFSDMIIEYCVKMLAETEDL